MSHFGPGLKNLWLGGTKLGFNYLNVSLQVQLNILLVIYVCTHVGSDCKKRNDWTLGLGEPQPKSLSISNANPSIKQDKNSM